MRFRDSLIDNIASPYGMTAVSAVLFIIAFTFPPTLYRNYLNEPDIIFLDPASLLFFLLCVLGFLLGPVLVSFIFPVRRFRCAQIKTRISPTLFLLIPLLAGTAFSVLSSVVLLHDNTFLLDVLLAGQGEQIKSVDSLQANGTLSQALPVLMGIVWWAMWREDQLDLRRSQRLVVHTAIVLATLALLLAAVLRVARAELMPIVGGIAVIFLTRKLARGKLTALSIVKFAFIFISLVVTLFLSFTILRGNSAAEDIIIANLLGYTIASYNRMAAILNGSLHYPFSGHGVYISSFFSFNNTFNKIFHLSQLLAWPDFNSVWRSEFDAVNDAGLNGGLIWSGAFGYIFSEMEWFSPLLFFVYGVATGWAWRALKLGKTAGILLYPWCAYCVLFWFGANYMLDPKLFDLLIDVIGLGLYEYLLARHLVTHSHEPTKL